jgi:thymidylate synthase (FAD)
MSFDTTRELRWQDKANRQSSIDANLNDESEAAIASEWALRIGAAIARAREDYEWALRQGIAKEQARVFLPEGLTTSKMYISGTMRSWYHYIQQRTHIGTQKEHRIVAQSCLQQLAPHMPNLFGELSTFANGCN